VSKNILARAGEIATLRRFTEHFPAAVSVAAFIVIELQAVCRRLI
jgi:hypothetical protein